ncbi:hypothetical protein [Flavicella sp.]|uniref:hypothetical protein n=1 Tax=Flavicella sp. TaxID=2957742 RepID=UPI00301698AD
MDAQEIEKLFREEVAKKDFKKRSGLDKQKVYNYRHRTTKLATMLQVLFNLDAISIREK